MPRLANGECKKSTAARYIHHVSDNDDIVDPEGQQEPHRIDIADRRGKPKHFDTVNEALRSMTTASTTCTCTPAFSTSAGGMSATRGRLSCRSLGGQMPGPV